MRSFLTLLSLAAIVGCASEAPAPATASAAATTKSPATAVATKQVCHKESVVGSQFPQTVCTDANADPNDPNVQRQLDEMNRTNGFQQGALSRGGVNR